MGLQSTWNVTSATEKYFNLIPFHFNCHMWLLAGIQYSFNPSVSKYIKCLFNVSLCSRSLFSNVHIHSFHYKTSFYIGMSSLPYEFNSSVKHMIGAKQIINVWWKKILYQLHLNPLPLDLFLPWLHRISEKGHKAWSCFLLQNPQYWLEIPSSLQAESNMSLYYRNAAWYPINIKLLQINNLVVYYLNKHESFMIKY